MDDWEKFNEATLPERENFNSSLSMEDITEPDYKHGKRVSKDFKIKNLRDYHDLYLESDLTLLVNVFENFRDMCLGIYELEPIKLISASVLVWHAALKKTQVKLDVSTDVIML